jgi:hypothetical protein
MSPNEFPELAMLKVLRSNLPITTREGRESSNAGPGLPEILRINGQQ